MNTEEARLIAHCVDPNIQDQVGIRNPNFHESKPEDPFDITNNESVSSEGKKAEKPRLKAGLLSIASCEARKRPVAELSATVPKKPRTVPKPRAKVKPELKAEVIPKLKLQAPLMVIAEGTSSQEPGASRNPMFAEETIDDIYTPEVPGPARFKKSNPTIEQPSRTSIGVASTKPSTPMKGDDRELVTERTEVRTPIQSEPYPTDSSAVPDDPQEETEEIELTLGETEIPMRPMVA